MVPKKQKTLGSLSQTKVPSTALKLEALPSTDI